MAVDPRLTKARKLLRSGIETGKQAEALASNRATGTRARYQHGYRAAVAALAALDAKPAK